MDSENTIVDEVSEEEFSTGHDRSTIDQVIILGPYDDAARQDQVIILVPGDEAVSEDDFDIVADASPDDRETLQVIILAPDAEEDEGEREFASDAADDFLF